MLGTRKGYQSKRTITSQRPEREGLISRRGGNSGAHASGIPDGLLDGGSALEESVACVVFGELHHVQSSL
jgi:hypothetical protein